MAGFIGSGTIYFDRQDASGKSTGLIPIGNATKLAIQPQAEIKERESRQKATYGQVLDSAPLNKPAKLSMTVDDIDADNLAMALLGDVSAFSQEAQNNAAVALTDIKLGKWLELGSVQLTAVTAKKNGAAGNLGEGTDFEVNKALGLIKFLAGAADGDDVDVTVSSAAVSGKRVQGATRPTIKCRILMDGQNINTGEDVRLDVFEATITPSKEIDFISSDFNAIEFGGTLNTPAGKSAPFDILVI